MTVFLRSAAVVAVLGLAPVANAGVEPYGEGFDGWKFTQEATPNGAIICKAWLGNVTLAKNTNGRSLVGGPASGISKRKYPESTIEIGGNAEMVTAEFNPKTLYLWIDDTMIQQVAAERGYVWHVVVGGETKTGYVEYNDSAMSALERVTECVTANGG